MADMTPDFRLDYDYLSQLLDTDGQPVAYKVRTSTKAKLLEIEGTANTPPDVSTYTKVSLRVRVSGTRKANITARHVNIYRTQGDSPNILVIRRKIVIFDPSLFYKALSLSKPTISYEDQTDWFLDGGRPETYNLPQSS